MLIVLGILFIFASIVIGCVIDINTENGGPFCFICGIVFSAGVLFVVMKTFGGSPTAMDVYQGRTTLEITYKDGVPIDSVVVFKDK